MTCLVHESRWGQDYLRVIQASLRVYPGVEVSSTNHAIDEPSLSPGEIEWAVSKIRDQLRIWTPFTFQEPTGAERTFRYEFEFRVEASVVETPVNGWVPQPRAPTMEVPSEHGRSVQSALEEARHHGFLNAAVIPRTVIGDPNSPHLRDDGLFVMRDREILDGYLLRASNVMVVGQDDLQGPDNQSAAHEMGHMFGLWHQFGQATIMAGPREGYRRLLRADQEALHWSVETPRIGIRWGRRVSGPAPVSARRPLSQVYG